MPKVSKRSSDYKASLKQPIGTDPQFFQDITEAVPTMIGVYNIVTGEYLYVNNAVKKLLGYTKQEFIKGGVRFVSSLIHPDDLQKIMVKNAEALSEANKPHGKINDKSIVEFEYRMKHKNGTYRWFSTYGRVFSRSKDGKVECVTNVSLDITDRKRTEDEHKQLLLSESAKEEMARVNARFSFLDRATQELTSTLDYEKILSKISSLAVPYLADWSVVHLAGADGMVRRLKTAYAWDYLAPLAKNFERNYGVAAISKLPANLAAFYTLKRARWNHVDKDWFRKAARDDRHRLLLERLNPISVMSIPLIVAKESIGTITFMRLHGSKKYSRSDFALGKELARRAYLAIDHARLYGLAQQEISERELAQKALLRSEERLALALESSKMGIWDYDIQNNSIVWSPQLEMLFGLEPGTFYGSYEDYINLIYPEDRKSLQKVVADSMRSGKGYAVEHRVIWPDGSVHWLLGMGKTYYDKKGKPIRMTGSTSNIDERKRIEQRKDDFISMASHELKTPVTSLKIFTQLLRRQYEKAGSESSLKYLAKMDEQINKLTRLIRELLDVSRINAGKLQITKNNFDIVDLTREIVEYFQETAPQKIKLRTSQKILVSADRDRISQVIINLLTNAIKYSPPKTSIIITLSLSSEDIQMSIQDFGMGIAKEHQSRIFERFYQVTELPEITLTGLGMGLYIARTIVALHGGKLWVESEKGKGSTFFFTLPR